MKFLREVLPAKVERVRSEFRQRVAAALDRNQGVLQCSEREQEALRTSNCTTNR
jgi:hypothetical protein